MPYLENVLDEATAEAVRQQIESQVEAHLRPYRWRFVGGMVAMVVGVAVGVSLYVDTIHTVSRHDADLAGRVCKAVENNQATIKSLIYRATPLRRSQTDEERRQIIATRVRLLGAIHPFPACVHVAD